MPTLRLRQVYNWSRFAFDGDRVFGDNRLPGIPEHFYRAEVLFEHPCGLYFGPNIEASSRQAADFRRSLFADGYALLGAKVGWKAKRWSAFIEGRNLTAERYIATVNPTNAAVVSRAATSAFYPGEGRAVFGGVEFRW